MSFLRTVFYTCSHFRNYRTIRDLPASTSLKYIAKLVTLLSLVGLIGFLPVAHDYVETFAAWMDKNLPPVSIKQGRVVTDVAQPYRAGDDKFLVILDTTGQTKQPETNAL